MRVWLADRPGALGSVASRIGAVGGDLVGIDILERGDGRVIDELTIDLPGEELIPLMLAKVGELDAVDVEDVRAVVAGLPYPLIDALEVAADILAERSVGGLFSALVAGVGAGFSAEWAAVVDPEGPIVLSSSTGAPPAPWLEAFVTGTRSAAPERAPPRPRTTWRGRPSRSRASRCWSAARAGPSVPASVASSPRWRASPTTVGASSSPWTGCGHTRRARPEPSALPDGLNRRRQPPCTRATLAGAVRPRLSASLRPTHPL